ncbi:hypothetical protein C8R48DRAFT_751682 [Suillus tomentosus]|nr:hypothetical protein C8R48DRAFT_751682 [Suillus tomentosus]
MSNNVMHWQDQKKQTNGGACKVSSSRKEDYRHIARTHAAAHLPANADEICEECFFQLVYIMKWYNVPSEGSKQVDMVAKDEKMCLFTACTSTADSDFLPFQQVWAGASKCSLLSHNAHGMNNAIEHGFHFAFAQTMREWIKNILEPWRKTVIEADPDLDDDQHTIVYLNCYPVHTSQDFHTYVWKKYSCVFLCFIPASCE